MHHALSARVPFESIFIAGRRRHYVSRAGRLHQGTGRTRSTQLLATCASCHGVQLQDDENAPDLAGNAFLKRWNDRSVGALFSFTESQMPVGRPRSLGATAYVDVIAHILASNGFLDGQKELTANGSALDKIIFDKPK